jgi:hypothetical protein
MFVTDEHIAVAGSLGNVMLFDRETLAFEMFNIGKESGKISVIDIFE